MDGQNINSTKEQNSGTIALEAEEARLRDIVRQKARRRSNPEEGNSHTDSPVDPTTNTSPSREITLSSLSEEAKNHQQPSESATRGTVSRETEQTASTKPTSNSQSESRSKSSNSWQSQEHLTTQQRARGRKRKRERRRMNREARRRGDTMPEDNRGDGHRDHSGGRGPPPPHFNRGPDGPDRWERGGYPPPRDWRGPPPDRRGPPPRGGEYDYSGYRSRSRSPRGRRRGRSRSRSASSVSSHSSGSESRSRSKSPREEEGVARKRSRSDNNSRERGRSGGSGDRRRSGSGGKRSGSGRGDGSRGSRGSRGSGSHKRSRHSRSPSTSSSASSSSSSEEEPSSKEDESAFSKDQRTVFVSQLVMRATEKDIRRYFKRKVGCQVKEVILLKDKRTGNHKGCAYVQLGRIEDVNKAIGVAGQPPDFQRFPILVKPSEAEKNYVISASSSTVTAAMMGTSTASKPILSADGKMIEAQKVYIGGLDPSVTEEHIFALFSQFGQLEKVTMQMDPATKTSRGYAFLTYRDPKEANLAIQTMSNQLLAGRPLKTGWASQASTVQGVDIVTSEAFPEDATVRAKKALTVLAQMSGVTDSALLSASISATAERALDAAMAGAQTAKPIASSVPTVAEARATLAAEQVTTTVTEQALSPAPAVPTGVKLIGGSETPTRNILVHNMFDKDQESGDTWPAEIKEEFEEECSKFGKIVSVTVMSNEPGGKIYASFETVEAATQCAHNLAGRWFDKRQLRVDFLLESEMPKSG